MSLGRDQSRGKALTTFRGLVEDKGSLGQYLTDWRFNSHLTLFRGIEATEEKKAKFQASSSCANLSPINFEMVTLRERKVPKGELKQPIIQLPIRSALKKDTEKNRQ